MHNERQDDSNVWTWVCNRALIALLANIYLAIIWVWLVEKPFISCILSRRLKICQLCSSATRFLRDYRIVWSLASDGWYRRLRNALAALSMIYRKNPISFILSSNTYLLTMATLFSSFFRNSPSSRGLEDELIYGSFLIILNEWFVPFSMKGGC